MYLQSRLKLSSAIFAGKKVQCADHARRNRTISITSPIIRLLHQSGHEFANDEDSARHGVIISVTLSQE